MYCVPDILQLLCVSLHFALFKSFFILSVFRGIPQFPRCRVSSPRCWTRRPCRCSGSCPASRGRCRASSSPTAWSPRRSSGPRSSSPATSTHTPSHTSVSSVEQNTVLCYLKRFHFVSLSRFSFMQVIVVIYASIITGLAYSFVDTSTFDCNSQCLQTYKSLCFIKL